MLGSEAASGLCVPVSNLYLGARARVRGRIGAVRAPAVRFDVLDARCHDAWNSAVTLRLRFQVPEQVGPRVQAQPQKGPIRSPGVIEKGTLHLPLSSAQAFFVRLDGCADLPDGRHGQLAWDGPSYHTEGALRLKCKVGV